MQLLILLVLIIVNCLKFKQKITGAAVNNGTKNVEVMGPLKYQINFWRTLKIPSTNCEIKLILTLILNHF